MKTSICLCLAVSVLAPALWAAPSDEAAEPASAAQKTERRITIRHEKPAVETEDVAFLGVETGRSSPTLAAQLGLPQGAGLIVRSVVPESPAAAVLQAHDVLLKLDDQLLVDTRQLAVLIRQHKEGDAVTLTFVRTGKQQTAKVTLGTHAVPKLSLTDGGGEIDILAPVAPGAVPHQEVNRMLSLLDERAPQAGRRVWGMAAPRAGAPGLRAMKVHPANSNIVFTDEQGELTLTIKDGRKTLVAKDAKGAQLFSGPIDTPEQRAGLPETVRSRLEQVESMDGFSFRADEDLRHELRVLTPSARRTAPVPQHRVLPQRRAPQPI